MGLFDKKNEEPEAAKDFLKRGQKHYKDKDYDNAIADCTKALELLKLIPKPNIDEVSDSQVTRGLSYYYQKKYELAIKDLGKVANDRGIMYSNPCYKALNEAKEMLKHERKLNAKDEKAKQTDAEPAYNRGESCRMKNQHDEAIAEYTKAIEIDNAHIKAYAGRGVSYRVVKKYDNSIADFNQAIKLDPKYSFAYFNRGETYRVMGKLDEAIKDLSEAVKLNENYSMAYASRAAAYKGKGENDKAISDLEKAISLDPNNQWAKNQLAAIGDEGAVEE